MAETAMVNVCSNARTLREAEREGKKEKGKGKQGLNIEREF